MNFTSKAAKLDHNTFKNHHLYVLGVLCCRLFISFFFSFFFPPPIYYSSLITLWSKTLPRILSELTYSIEWNYRLFLNNSRVWGNRPFGSGNQFYIIWCLLPIYLCKGSMSGAAMDTCNSILWARCNMKSLIYLVKKKKKTITLVFKHRYSAALVLTFFHFYILKNVVIKKWTSLQWI